MSGVPATPEHTRAQLPDRPDYWDFVSLATHQLNEHYRPSEVSASHLALAINRASETIQQVSESLVHRPRNLKWSGFRMLFVLWNVGEIEQSRLTVLTNSSKATVSNLAASLIKQDLVSRRSSDTDRRTFVLKLTDKGRSLVEELYLEQNELFVQWASVLTLDERETLQRLVDKLMKRRDIFGARRPD